MHLLWFQVKTIQKENGGKGFNLQLKPFVSKCFLNQKKIF